MLPINRISGIKDCSIGSGLKDREKNQYPCDLTCTYHAGVRNRKRSHVTSWIPSCSSSTTVALRGEGQQAGWPMACDTFLLLSLGECGMTGQRARLVESLHRGNDGQARCPPPPPQLFSIASWPRRLIISSFVTPLLSGRTGKQLPSPDVNPANIAGERSLV